MICSIWLDGKFTAIHHLLFPTNQGEKGDRLLFHICSDVAKDFQKVAPFSSLSFFFPGEGATKRARLIYRRGNSAVIFS
jgi:hypothetical protein